MLIIIINVEYVLGSQRKQQNYKLTILLAASFVGSSVAVIMVGCYSYDIGWKLCSCLPGESLLELLCGYLHCLAQPNYVI